MTGEERHERTRKMMASAARRISVIEYVLLAMAGALALLGGALAAWGLRAAAGFPFRPAWAVCSLLFFVVPGVIVLGRERRIHCAKTVPVIDNDTSEDENDVR